MKCVCGYNTEEVREPYGMDGEGKEWVTPVGNEPFIEVSTVSSDYIQHEYIIYACPKCGTLKIEI